MKYKKLNTSETNSDNDIILDNGTVFLDPNNDLKISDGVTSGGKNLIKRVQDITVSSGTIISTANTNQDLTITTNGAGDIFIGADKNMIFDMNAFSAKGILLQDSQEDGYDNPGTPSTLKIGSIYHDTGTMVISSDGSIINASGVQVNGNGDPSENPVYGGLWLTNGQDTGFKVPAQSGSFYGALSPNVEIHNNNKVWYFRDDGNLSLPESGNINLYNNSSLAQGTFDNGTNGNGGISLNCAVGYELNWQGGHLKSTSNNGITNETIQIDSPISLHSVGANITSLLLHMDGDFNDSSPNNLVTTANGQISINSSIKKFGSGSLDCTVAGNYLTVTNTPDFDFGTGDFTVEFWYYPTTLDQNGVLISFNTPNSNCWSLFRYGEETHGGVATQMGFGRLGIGVDVGGDHNMTANNWYHIAVSRANGDIKVFVDGQIIAAANTSSIEHLSYGCEMVIGSPSNPYDDNTNGYIDELRVIKGSAVYTGNFTPPLSPFNILTTTSTINISGTGITFPDGSVQNTASGIVSSNTSVVPNSSPINNIVSISQADYDALGSYDPNTLYVIT